MLLYILLVILLVILYQTAIKEQFSAYGALTQLYMKDDQDGNLTYDTQKYYPPQYYYSKGYRPTLNIPDYLTAQ